MTPKERILAAIRGESVDRTPWSPFLAYWWEAQREQLRRPGQLSYMESVGADPLLRGFGAAWQVEFCGVERSASERAGVRRERLSTPVGALELGYRYSREGDTWFLVEHPVRRLEELKVLQWIYEHARVTPSGEADELWRAAGERGVVLPLVGVECKTCFQSLIEKWVGTENMAYFAADAPEKVEECLLTMRYASERTAELSADSAAEGFIFWEDSSTTNISPDMFARFAAPEIAAWGNALHSAGKLLVHHACGHLAGLLERMGALPIDAIESISPPPTGDIDIGDAFELLPRHVALIGGIEPVFFLNCTDAELEARVDELIKISRGRRYVLANSDSCPPGVSERKFKTVSEAVRALSPKS